MDPMFYFDRASYRLVMSTMLQGSLGMLMYEVMYYITYFTVYVGQPHALIRHWTNLKRSPFAWFILYAIYMATLSLTSNCFVVYLYAIYMATLSLTSNCFIAYSICHIYGYAKPDI